MNYRRPPIVEAVVEFQFAAPVDFAFVAKLAARVVSKYQVDETERQQGVMFHSDGRSTPVNGEIGRKLSSRDMRHTVIVRLGSIIFASLAPYEGWDAFEDRIAQQYRVLSGVSGYPAIKQIGMRYINRIDIHKGLFPNWVASDFLNNTPSPLPDHFLQHVEFSENEKRSFVIKIVTATATSPVPYSDALLLDIDVFRRSALPASLPDMIALLREMRALRNETFESSITDRARELFSR